MTRPFVIPTRRDCADKGTTYTVERLGDDAVDTFGAHPADIGRLAVIVRQDGAFLEIGRLIPGDDEDHLVMLAKSAFRTGGTYVEVAFRTGRASRVGTDQDGADHA